MKKLVLVLMLIVPAFLLQAQIPVSTTPQNKNVILEEFTGIHCGFCPQGHLVAHNIMTANPNRAYAIAVHTGSYATPGAGEPDYRTSFGTSLASQTALTGYPAATVNRHVFSGLGQTSGGTAMSRTNWTSASTTILGQPSYLNVGVAAQVNYTTRVLTVHCQVYYTGNSSVTTNKLNIAILQNNVKGPQSGSSGNPTMVTPDGQYLHQHMLRHMLTGQWGVSIPNTNTASGTLKVDTTITYTVPADYTGVPVNLAELEIIAFVAEGNQEIISGSGCTVNQPTIDAAITSITGLPLIQCTTNPIAPTVVLKNKGTDVLTSAVINYSVDGGTTVSQNWSGTLAAGATANVTITNPITPVNGHHTVRCFSSLPNGVADLNALNDDYSAAYNAFLNYSTSPVNEEFTSTAFPPTNWVIDGLHWSRQSVSSFGVGSGSARVYFYGAETGAINDMYIYGLDLSGVSSYHLSFDHAYAQYQTGYDDRLQVQVSTNCGSTWTSIFDKAGSTLATAPASSSSFSPSASQWVTNNINLNSYVGQPNVIIRFHTISDYGNNLFIDKINTGTGTGVNESYDDSNIQIFPNPASNVINIVNAENADIMLYDLLGKLVMSANNISNNFSINVSDFATGNYIVKIIDEGNITTDKISVIK
ncbi:MAG TPA: Omp28-related outer membrane protein [Bacteroidales bacterium]|nr:Omp28-related outer membrane protein [Bacteroidales bacterium]HOH84126.1 Omp28-related outer membrane protein [Bacteroidales bacterium]HPB26187.1 Omp28-related outer membrane protein [Bacteroidales bacterium]HQN16994.1 Omp28-related outer membrane protein [Bacteroidales bacterium]HQP16520.1 Omp28-related outer membrane protein [Bacteroidales bacterium]